MTSEGLASLSWVNESAIPLACLPNLSPCTTSSTTYIDTHMRTQTYRYIHRYTHMLVCIQSTMYPPHLLFNIPNIMKFSLVFSCDWAALFQLVGWLAGWLVSKHNVFTEWASKGSNPHSGAFIFFSYFHFLFPSSHLFSPFREREKRKKETVALRMELESILVSDGHKSPLEFMFSELQLYRPFVQFKVGGEELVLVLILLLIG